MYRQLDTYQHAAGTYFELTAVLYNGVMYRLSAFILQTAIRHAVADDWAVAPFCSPASIQLESAIRHAVADDWAVVPFCSPASIQLESAIRLAAADDWAVVPFCSPGSIQLESPAAEWSHDGPIIQPQALLQTPAEWSPVSRMEPRPDCNQWSLSRSHGMAQSSNRASLTAGTYIDYTTSGRSITDLYHGKRRC